MSFSLSLPSNADVAPQGTIRPQQNSRAGQRPPSSGSSAPPARPRPGQESLGARLLGALAPRVPQAPRKNPPPAFGPSSSTRLPTEYGGTLSLTEFPGQISQPRGVVVLAHPWVPGGQAYFYRRSRIPALHRAGYQVVTFDFPGFGDSRRSRAVFADRDVEAVLDVVAQKYSSLPIYFWGVSGGAYWGHLALTRRQDITAAAFEEVPVHLIEWSRRITPKRDFCYDLFLNGLPSAHHFLDLRAHAPHLPPACYVSSEDDPGIPPQEVQALARTARGTHLSVPAAGHLDAIKREPRKLIQLVLETFADARPIRRS